MEVSERNDRDLKEIYEEIESRAITLIKEEKAVDNPILTKEKEDSRYSIAVILRTGAEADAFLKTASKELQETEPDIQFVPDGFRHINLREVTFNPKGRLAARIDEKVVKEYYRAVREEFSEPGEPIQLRLMRILPAIDKEQDSVSIVGAFLPLNARIIDVRAKINHAIEHAGLPLAGRLGDIQVLFSTLGRMIHPPKRNGTKVRILDLITEINSSIPLNCETVINEVDVISTTKLSYVNVAKHVFIWPPISLIGKQSQDSVRFLKPRQRLQYA